MEYQLVTYHAREANRHLVAAEVYPSIGSVFEYASVGVLEHCRPMETCSMVSI